MQAGVRMNMPRPRPRPIDKIKDRPTYIHILGAYMLIPIPRSKVDGLLLVARHQGAVFSTAKCPSLGRPTPQ